MSIQHQPVEVRLSATVHAQLRHHLLQNEDEQFAYGLGSYFDSADGRVLTVARVLPLNAQQLEHQGRAAVAPKPRIARRITDLAARAGMSVVEFHSHPFARRAHFSEQDRSAYNYLLPIWEQKLRACAAVVLAQDGAAGWAWDQDGRRLVPLVVRVLEKRGWLTLASEGPQQLLAHGPGPSSVAHALAQANAAALKSLRVGLVGCGGLGLPLALALAQMGIGRLVFCDPDSVEQSNLQRLPGVRPVDVGRAKVDVVKALIRRLGQGTGVSAWRSVPSSSAGAQRALAACDVLVGAMDNLPGRWWLNAFAVSHVIPFLDLGSQVYPLGELQAAGRLTRVVPGSSACLQCRGRFRGREAEVQLALQALADSRLAEQMADHGYGLGQLLGGTGVQALPLNLPVVAEALWEVLQICGLPRASSDDLFYDASVPAWTTPFSADRLVDCPECGEHGWLGAGQLRDLRYRRLCMPQPGEYADAA